MEPEKENKEEAGLQSPEGGEKPPAVRDGAALGKTGVERGAGGGGYADEDVVRGEVRVVDVAAEPGRPTVVLHVPFFFSLVEVLRS